MAVLASEVTAVAIRVDRGRLVDGPGDLITCEVAREDVTPLVARLRSLGLTAPGSIALTQIDWVEDETVEEDAGQVDAIVWEEVAQRAHDDARLTWAYLLLMAVAGMLAGTALLTNNLVLVVGAMIVSPDFGPTAGLAVAIIGRRWHQAGLSLRALLIGFAVAAVTAWFLTVVLDLTDRIPASYLGGQTLVGDLVSEVNGIAFLVAFGAGIAGAVSLGTAKSGAVVGVAVSITTIPAAANIGVALALTEWHIAAQSVAMLLTNVIGLVSAEVLTFVVARRLSMRALRRDARAGAQASRDPM